MVWDWVEEQTDCLSPFFSRHIFNMDTNSSGIPYHTLYYSFLFKGFTSMDGYLPVPLFILSIINPLASFNASTCIYKCFWDSSGDNVRNTNSSFRIMRCPSSSTCLNSIPNIVRTSRIILLRSTFAISSFTTYSGSEQLSYKSSSSSSSLMKPIWLEAYLNLCFYALVFVYVSDLNFM